MLKNFYKNIAFNIFENRLIYLGLFFLIFIFTFFATADISSAQTKSPDAIAIRIMANPEHYSPAVWYDRNIKTKGSPQSLIVDGYEAVRDGRTVYINTANVDNGNLYTNIDIISYNQQAESATIDIFGQILSHWKFNTNLAAPGSCSATSTASCLNDDDCPLGGYCDSAKAKITRDTIRLGRLADVQTGIESYVKDNGHYPILAAGSYLPNKTISVWPSWQETLGKILGGGLPIDPINKLAACPGYDDITCWNEDNKTFVWAADLNAGRIPNDNYVLLYSSDNKGQTYKICTYSETGLISSGLACNAACVPFCANKNCGDDGCGGSCGSCSGAICVSGVCQSNCGTAPGCRANLANANMVGGYCASGKCYNCNPGYSWNGSACVSSCVPDGCNGNCPFTCSSTADPDCGGTGCCNDGICNNGETTSTCPNDCPVTCNATPGCRTTVPANSSTVSGTCVSGGCYVCNSGYGWDGANCTANCSTTPGCKTSLANASVTGGYCSTGSCYACSTGYSWNGSNCLANCNATPGCRNSIANASVVSGYCSSGNSCYACNSGYTWNGSSCVLSGPACSASPGCRATAPANATVVTGNCTGGSCYTCNSGYSWDGNNCVANCSTPAGCQTNLANASVVGGYCTSGSCYACNGSYFWNSSACVPSAPSCSTPPGCRSGLANATAVSGSCPTGQACYSCNAGYNWDGSSCAPPPPTCTPDCAGKTCGDDSCGGSCGGCGSQTCWNGNCVTCNCSGAGTSDVSWPNPPVACTVSACTASGQRANIRYCDGCFWGSWALGGCNETSCNPGCWYDIMVTTCEPCPQSLCGPEGSTQCIDIGYGCGPGVGNTQTCTNMTSLPGCNYLRWQTTGSCNCH